MIIHCTVSVVVKKKRHFIICKFILTTGLNYLLETHIEHITIFHRRDKTVTLEPSSTLLVTECLFQLTFLGLLLSPSVILIKGLMCHWQPCLA